MLRPAIGLTDIFPQHGEAYRAKHKHPREHLRVMRLLETWRTATLRGHVEKCSPCDHIRIAYNSCRNRHCPKCQGSKRVKCLESRQEELLPVQYFDVVFTAPEQVARIAFHNKREVHDILFAATAQTPATIARDPTHGGGRTELLRHPAYRGTKPSPPSTPALCGAGGRSESGRNGVAWVPERVLSAGPGLVAFVSLSVPRSPGKSPSEGGTSLLRRVGRPARRGQLSAVSCAPEKGRMGRVLKTALRWATTSPPLSRAVHAPCGNLPPAHPESRRGPGDFPMEGAIAERRNRTLWR